ncbi:hypothetical protein GCM10027160_03590 [Streptomyces calidiresistens]
MAVAAAVGSTVVLSFFGARPRPSAPGRGSGGRVPARAGSHPVRRIRPTRPAGTRRDEKANSEYDKASL